MVYKFIGISEDDSNYGLIEDMRTHEIIEEELDTIISSIDSMEKEDEELIDSIVNEVEHEEKDNVIEQQSFDLFEEKEENTNETTIKQNEPFYRVVEHTIIPTNDGIKLTDRTDKYYDEFGKEVINPIKTNYHIENTFDYGGVKTKYK